MGVSELREMHLLREEKPKVKASRGRFKLRQAHATAADLKKALKRHQLSQVTVVRLKPYNPGKFKSSLLKENVW